MKAVNLNFVDNHTWRIWWIAVLFLTSIIFGASLAQTLKLQKAENGARRETAGILAQLQSRKDAMERAAASSLNDPAMKQRLAIESQLRVDWNLVFSTMENLQEPDLRLAAFSVDATSQAIRLEYEVNSIDQASRVTAAINGGAAGPWRLDGISQSVNQSTRLRASWSASLRDLR